MPGRVIVVEDEPLTRASIARHLQQEGYRVREACDVAACRAALKAERADIVIVDLGLPGPDGATLVRDLRNDPGVDLVVVTQRADVADRVRMLDEGADDYLVKPVALSELTARLRVLQRRRGHDGVFSCGSWVVDSRTRRVTTHEGEPVPLTRGEFDLLFDLVRARGKIVSREMLSQTISRSEAADVRSVDALVSRLRRKLGPKGNSAVLTAPGFGYRLGVTASPFEPGNEGQSHRPEKA
jgi:two-component system, OmpR family, torCAD operon response regulator TorR